jgi:hypothetical protein
MCLISDGIMAKYGIREAREIVLGLKPNQAVPEDWVGEFDGNGNVAFHLSGEDGNPQIEIVKRGYMVFRENIFS